MYRRQFETTGANAPTGVNRKEIDEARVLEILISELTPRQRRVLGELYDCLKQRAGTDGITAEVARRIGTTASAVSQTLSRIQEKTDHLVKSGHGAL